MGERIFRFMRHAITMVGRNRRSYAMLSVTIVLSFSLLLGYLGWTDSSLYNTYKSTFHKDRNLVYVYQDEFDRGLIELLKEQAAEYNTTANLEILRCRNLGLLNVFETEEGVPVVSPAPNVLCVPRHSWMLADYFTPLEVTWLDGESHPDVDLKSGELLVDEQFFQALGLEGENPEIFLSLYNVLKMGMYETLEEITFQGTFTVIGTVPSTESISLKFDKEIEEASIAGNYHPRLLFSMEDLNPDTNTAFDWSSHLVFYTQSPEQVTALARSMNFNGVQAVYEDQDAALEEMRTVDGTKAAIAAALLLLLGINLYSSFANALNDRKFEIGVKRAIGASGFQIVRQFLYESLLVMGANILASVWLVLTVGLTYKVIFEHIPNASEVYPTFILYISPYSIAMFAVCSIGLTVMFSLIFAYKSTQVQIVDYLKAE